MALTPDRPASPMPRRRHRQVKVAVNVAAERERAWKVAWPLGVLCLAMFPMFVIGAHAFLWLLPGVVFGPALIMRRTLRLPPTAIPLAFFLLFVVLGIVQMNSLPAIVVFVYRFLVFVSMYCSFVWVYQLTPYDLSSERLTRWLAGLWITMIAFGLLGVALGTVVDTMSPLQRFLPGSLARDEFLDSLMAWRFAEVQRIGGIPIPRPSAPLPYTNGWGSTVALLTPFFFRAWLESKDRRRRTFGIVMAVLAIIPITVSLNRGVFVSIGLCLLWVAWERLLDGDPRWLIRTTAVVGVVAVAFVATPLGDLVMNRLEESGKSNSARASVYGLAWEGTLQSPVLGHGAPRIEPGLPPVGTHGLVWYLMYSHGLVALTLFIGSLVVLFLVGRRTRTPEGRWCRAVLVIAMFQVLIYGLLPQIVLVGVAAGLMCRDSMSWTPRAQRRGVPVPGVNGRVDEQVPRGDPHAPRSFNSRRRGILEQS